MNRNFPTEVPRPEHAVMDYECGENFDMDLIVTCDSGEISYVVCRGMNIWTPVIL